MLKLNPDSNIFVQYFCKKKKWPESFILYGYLRRYFVVPKGLSVYR